MKIAVQNLGIIESAGIEIGDLTIVCGNNNFGKTYLTYAFYGVLKYLRSAFALIPIDQKSVDELIDQGETVIQLAPLLELLPSLIKKASGHYSKNLSEVFAADKAHFENTRFTFEIPVPDRTLYKKSIRETVYGRSGMHFQFSFFAETMVLSIRQLSKPAGAEEPPRDIIALMVSDIVRDYLLEPIIPNVYISSTERTGVATFQRELDFTRNRLLELVGNKAKNIPANLLFSKFHNDYPLPVRDNVDFIRNLPNIANRESRLMKEHPELLSVLSDIIGGTYKATKDGFISYQPMRGVKLSIGESSSSVRSLLDVTFYLKNRANPGDLFMIDEPELNLHPSKQRMLARLLARLVNCGIKVFMTTHSDYIVKEINTLLLLNQKGDSFKKIAAEEHYEKEELLDVSKVHVYIAGKYKQKKQENMRRTLCHSFASAPISQDKGIEVESFDTTIDEMNRIQDRILWETPQ